jgi:hypothetical protein
VPLFAHSSLHKSFYHHIAHKHCTLRKLRVQSLNFFSLFAMCQIPNGTDKMDLCKVARNCKSFRFIIACNYASFAHSGTPCVSFAVLGWLKFYSVGGLISLLNFISIWFLAHRSGLAGCKSSRREFRQFQRFSTLVRFCNSR